MYEQAEAESDEGEELQVPPLCQGPVEDGPVEAGRSRGEDEVQDARDPDEEEEGGEEGGVEPEVDEGPRVRTGAAWLRSFRLGGGGSWPSRRRWPPRAEGL